MNETEYFEIEMTVANHIKDFAKLYTLSKEELLEFILVRYYHEAAEKFEGEALGKYQGEVSPQISREIRDYLSGQIVTRITNDLYLWRDDSDIK